MVEDTGVAPAAVFAPDHEDLSGTYLRTLDEKCRAVLPPPWREHYGAGGKLGTWVDRLALWTPRSYRQAAGEVLTQERMGLMPDGAYQDFVGDALDVALDAQGRLLLPAELRARAGIGDKGAEVALVGAGHHVEIWDRGRRDAVRGTRDPDAAAKLLQGLKF